MRAYWFTIALLLLAISACTDDGATTPTPGATQNAESTPAGAFADDLCPLLSPDDVVRTTGYELLEAQRNNADPFHYCTFYLDIPGCEMQCALSLEYLGVVDASRFNSPDVFRQALIDVNVGADFTFQDDVFGPNSWLATAQAGDIPQWKVVYFQVNGVAYNLHSPLAPEYVLTEQQVIDVTNVAIDHLSQ